MTILLFDHPMVREEKWDEFTPTDHHTWKTLFERQSQILQNRACDEIIGGMQKLEICHHQIPKISEINTILKRETNFSVIPVKGFIPEDLFFRFLANRTFPSTCFIRKPEQLDYLEEPDIFHDVFGHVPLLVNPIFADFMQAFGEKGLEAIDAGMLTFAATLYWFTVEFGLIQTPKGRRIYGAGITSSPGESVYSLESKTPTRTPFSLNKVLPTQYRTDVFQKDYFVITCFDELFDTLKALDWHDVKVGLTETETI